VSPQRRGVYFSLRRRVQGVTLSRLIGLSWCVALLLGAVTVHVGGVFAWPDLGIASALALLALQCWLLTGLFICAHDAMHGSLAPGMPRTNASVCASLLFFYAGFNWTRIRKAHWQHHRRPATIADPDFGGVGVRPLRWYVAFVGRYFGLGSALFMGTFFWGHIILLGAEWHRVVIFHSLPAVLSSFQLFWFGTYLPHRCSNAEFPDRHRARSNDWPEVLSLITCFHFGYHLEHHRHPDVPWWLLPEVHRHARRPSSRKSKAQSEIRPADPSTHCRRTESEARSA